MTKILMANYMNYEKSRSSRRLVDRIHVEYSCCGVKSIDDFVDLSEIDGRLPTQTKLWPCNEWEYCGVPLSCCKSMSCSQRIELLNDGWDPKNTTDNWFNKRGCVEKMDIAFLFFNFPSFILTDFIMILVLGFHMCSMILSQIQVTSSATLHGAHLELSEYSYGWLLDIGQPDPASLMKKLNPDLDEFEMINHVEGNEEMEIVNSDGTVTASENMTDTEITTQLTTEGTDTSESNLNSVGTTKTSSSTSSIMEKQHPNASSDQVYIVDSDAGPPSKELSPKKGNQKKPTKEPKNIKGNQKKKSDRAMKPKGKIQKAKNTNTKKKATTKKNVQQKKPKAKPKKK
uniref:Transmembrane protein n=2 Tax=Caenorhabditis tropicalis TaxID=1561998 RepID=A0A1I7UUD9_9PELO